MHDRQTIMLVLLIVSCTVFILTLTLTIAYACYLHVKKTGNSLLFLTFMAPAIFLASVSFALAHTGYVWALEDAAYAAKYSTRGR